MNDKYIANDILASITAKEKNEIFSNKPFFWMLFYLRKLNTFLSVVATYNADFLLQAWHAERELPAP